MMQKMQKLMNRRNRKGFTLIELIVVIAIIAILAAILIPRFGGFTDKAKQTQALVDAKQVATAIDSLEAEGSTVTVATVASMSGIAATEITLDTSATFDAGFKVSVNNFSAGRATRTDTVGIDKGP